MKGTQVVHAGSAPTGNDLVLILRWFSKATSELSWFSFSVVLFTWAGCFFLSHTFEWPVTPYCNAYKWKQELSGKRSKAAAAPDASPLSVPHLWALSPSRSAHTAPRISLSLSTGNVIESLCLSLQLRWRSPFLRDVLFFSLSLHFL